MKSNFALNDALGCYVRPETHSIASIRKSRTVIPLLKLIHPHAFFSSPILHYFPPPLFVIEMPQLSRVSLPLASPSRDSS